MKILKRLLGLAFLIFVGTYVYFTAQLYFEQDKLLFHPAREWKTTPESLGLSFEDIRFEQLSGWFIENPKNRGTVLVCHGNAGNISDRVPEIQFFHRMGFNVFIFDYHGYGKSQNAPLTENGLYRDADAAWFYLTQTRKIAPQQIILCGRSLGATIAAYLASRYDARALILESGFTTLWKLGQEKYPLLPVRVLSKYDLPTVDFIKKVEEPVFIVHSRDDTLIPLHHGKEIFEAAKKPKQFLEISGPHNDGYIESEKKYQKTLEDFLSHVVGT